MKNQSMPASLSPVQRPTSVKRHNTKAEKARYCQLWLDSEMSKIAFCRKHGINIKNLSNWINGIENPYSSEPAFRAIRIMPSELTEGSGEQKSSQKHQPLRISLPSGLSIHVPVLVDVNSILELLRGLNHAA